MEKTGKPIYLTATSLTARQINRRIIRSIIYRQQPISRADTARETGLQRSTVSLIVDELINEGWIVEGEHVRIPRGRRPIYLQINSEQAGLYALHVGEKSLCLAVADLNGTIQWTQTQELGDFSTDALAKVLGQIKKTAAENHKLQMKGIGVAIDFPGETQDAVKAAITQVFDMPSAINSVAVGNGKAFLLSHKDAKLARNHLVSINVASSITMGVLINGQPLVGAHAKAGGMLSDDTAQTGAGHSAAPEDLKQKLRQRIEFAVAAYDPGLILVTGELTDTLGTAESALEEELKPSGATDTVVRVLETGGVENSIYLKGALALILGYFLDECPS